MENCTLDVGNIIYNDGNLYLILSKLKTIVKCYEFELLRSIKIDTSIIFQSIGDSYAFNKYKLSNKPITLTIKDLDTLQNIREFDCNKNYIKCFRNEGRSVRFKGVVHEKDLKHELLKVKIQHYVNNLNKLFDMRTSRNGELIEYNTHIYNEYVLEAKAYIVKLIKGLKLSDSFDINFILNEAEQVDILSIIGVLLNNVLNANTNFDMLAEPYILNTPTSINYWNMDRYTSSFCNTKGTIGNEAALKIQDFYKHNMLVSH